MRAFETLAGIVALGVIAMVLLVGWMLFDVYVVHGTVCVPPSIFEERVCHATR